MHSFVLQMHFTVSYLVLFFEPGKPNSEADKLIQDNNLMPIFKSEDDGKTDSDSSKWLFSPTSQSGTDVESNDEILQDYSEPENY